MRLALLMCVLCCLIKVSGHVANAEEGFNREQRLTIGITRNLFRNKNPDGPLELPQSPDQVGTLTAQLFDEGGIEPIWSEVHPNYSPPSDGVREPLTLGKTTRFEKDGQPIPFNNSPYILLTLQLGDKEFVTPRLAIAVAGYSHQSGAAFEAVGDLLQKINEYEKRIQVLERANNEILKKLYREVYGEDPPLPPQPAAQ